MPKADFSGFYRMLQQHRREVVQRAEFGNEAAVEQLDDLSWLPDDDEEE